MKAIYVHAAGDVRLSEVQTAPIGPGDVRVKISRGGICGSDLHYYQHGGFGAVRLREPMILGHEVAGHVSETGSDVHHLREGDLVAVSPSRPCKSCRFCLQGLPNQCLNMQFYGSAMPFPHIQGAFREDLVAKAEQCVPAGKLSPAEAAMAEPLSVCLHAVRRAGELLGKRVIVTGCGPIGVLAVLAARRAGAAEIVAVDIAENPLQFARRAGADRVINSAEETEALSHYSTDKGTFDILMECSGAQAALAAGIGALRPRGVIVQLGLSGDMSLPMTQITAKELELRGSFRFHEEFPVAIDLMSKGLIDVNPLLTHTLPLASFREAFETASDRSRAMKVQLDFGA
ncbi:alcohol dehydrogenase catalytic domain-containing protein [Stappia sp. GBMRC 2046]|uniref:Alcohol dehydrogenase catalytic domain-containing protein n=1 Tax=Stappia sediminis TaxID=2692190 RepID=A0A7X3LSD7_9HYPH|nr:L-idonate 5-dehydrogenase [Stappia sediminis]MXN64235.1 alcohol dehydrogenase catalytic domain-containing protein [Stappia sediminis]